MNVRLAIRGFKRDRKKFEELVDMEEAELAAVLPGLADKHCKEMAEGRLTMIEIEFIDEPDVNSRYFRFGSSPRGMVRPMAVDLTTLPGQRARN